MLADQDVSLDAGGNVSIEAAQNSSSSSSFNETKKSGLMSGGGLSVTIGKQSQSLDEAQKQSTAAGSTVGSVGGNVSITAGKTYTQTGSDVLTPAGDIDITAQRVDINEARETGSQSTEQTFKQSGLTVAVTSPVISSLQTAQSQLQAAGNTQSSRMQLLATANAAFNLKQGADALKAGQGKADGNAADQAGGIGISASVGSSSSQSKQSSSSDSARGSTIKAGGNITIKAIGAGEDSDLTIQGSTVEAGGKTTLKADDEVRLLAAANTTQEDSRQSSKSGSVGVTMQLGTGGAQMGVTASASRGTGRGAGNGTTYTNSQVEGQTVHIESGGDTTLKGAVVKGDRVTATVGGSLTVESLQDTSQYDEKSQQVGGSVTIGPASGALTTTDLHNRASFEAQSVSVAVGTSGGKVTPGGVGFGLDKGSASSVTTAGISGVAGNTAARTGDKETGIGQIFNKEQAQQEVAAQVAITQEFGKQASMAVGDYAGSQKATLSQQANKPTQKPTPTKKHNCKPKRPSGDLPPPSCIRFASGPTLSIQARGEMR